MAPCDVAKLQTQLRAVRADLRRLSAKKDIDEVLRLIVRPAWTTPAERRLVSAVVEAMDAHVKAISGLQRTLVAGSREIVAGAGKTTRG